jgi:hypothetical protein
MGTYSIHSIDKVYYLLQVKPCIFQFKNILYLLQGGYLQTQTSPNFSKVTFTDQHPGKFVLFFHPQNQHAGLLVDISSPAGYFLCMEDDNYVAANTRISPTNKFLIVPADE